MADIDIKMPGCKHGENLYYACPACEGIKTIETRLIYIGLGLTKAELSDEIKSRYLRDVVYDMFGINKIPLNFGINNILSFAEYLYDKGVRI